MYTITIISIAVTGFMSSYAVYLINQEKEKFTQLQGLIASMAIGSLTGLMAGYLLAVLSEDQFLATGAGMIIGFTFGFLAGQPSGILSVLNGSISGLISGIIGAVFGIIIKTENPFLMLIILLVFYVIITGFVILFLKVEANEKLTLDTNGISPFAILSAGVLLLSLFLFLYSSDIIKTPEPNTAASNGQVQQNQSADTSGADGAASAATEIDVTKEQSPTVSMNVTENGYSPSIIRVKKGVPVKLEVNNPLENSCLDTLNMPDFHFNNINLKVGTTTLTFTPKTKGEYTFSCGMNMFKGKIIVE